MEIERRTLLGGAGALATIALLPAAARAAPATRAPIDVLAYRDVTLLEGPAQIQAGRTLETLLAMDEARLLRPFRERAGLPVAADRFGGWYDFVPEFHSKQSMVGFIPGHSFGQYVSSLARGYAVTHDARAKAKVDRLIAGYAPTITPDFYKNYTLPAYTFDKTLIGLIDAHQFAGNAQALKLVAPSTDAVLPWLPGHALNRPDVEKQPRAEQAFGWDETYTLAENLYLAADRGAGERYRTMARAYQLNDAYFFPLAAGQNVLPGRHAYSHMNALASAAEAYIVDGDPRHLAAARNGMGFILDQSFATGGWGPNEGYVVPGSGGLGDSLDKTHASFEAPCGSYGHMKVARYLMRITGDSRYGDGMERLLYNAALGALPLKSDGTAFYYADYNQVGHKAYYDTICPCCSGSIGQLTADYGINAVLGDAHGLFVNLYLPLLANWRRDGETALTLTQDGNYPLGDDIEMSIFVQRPVRMVLRLRIPAWAGPATRIAVNGRVHAGVVPGRFATIAREWREGDRITLTIDRSLRLEAVDAQHPDRVAVMQGPLALFALGDNTPSFTRAQLASIRQRRPGGVEWGFAGSPTFAPYFAFGSGTSRVYQVVTA
ncbi:MAG TPA: beta-L-arabinofuranosidase domain-containing protein [Sphingomonas sp.]|uniref:beta-L-arabinofuranosidase domain-containing protein n=1 Tax=Sphingomonas sp. TaxID=28214 RepID=UPI002B5574F7|nr:beta-L-arabinofuranosidase domain-containing protein [Sphingomonas sp.]HMI18646.1 beta-L-arabinofuranosidase domain-containing protein [Sphingomonas sp.]